MNEIWNFLDTKAGGIGILLTIILALLTAWRSLTVRRQELRAQNFNIFHKLVHSLVAPEEGREKPWLDVQIASLFELQRFPAYYEVSLSILRGLRSKWDRELEGENRRLIAEMDSTISEIGRKTKTLHHCIKQWFRNFLTY